MQTINEVVTIDDILGGKEVVRNGSVLVLPYFAQDSVAVAGSEYAAGHNEMIANETTHYNSQGVTIDRYIDTIQAIDERNFAIPQEDYDLNPRNYFGSRPDTKNWAGIPGVEISDAMKKELDLSGLVFPSLRLQGNFTRVNLDDAFVGDEFVVTPKTKVSDGLYASDAIFGYADLSESALSSAILDGTVINGDFTAKGVDVSGDFSFRDGIVKGPEGMDLFAAKVSGNLVYDGSRIAGHMRVDGSLARNHSYKGLRVGGEFFVVDARTDSVNIADLEIGGSWYEYRLRARDGSSTKIRGIPKKLDAKSGRFLFDHYMKRKAV